MTTTACDDQFNDPPIETSETEARPVAPHLSDIEHPEQHARADSPESDGETFAAWLAREIPPGTVISNPAWWAPRILRAALRATPQPAAQAAPAVLEDTPEAIEGTIQVLKECGGFTEQAPVIRQLRRYATLLAAPTQPAATAAPSDDCDDVDAILRIVGLDPERCRTEGGALNVGRVRTLWEDVVSLAAQASGQAPSDEEIIADMEARGWKYMDEEERTDIIQSFRVLFARYGQASAASVCVGCEGDPTPENDPCAVCGKPAASAEPSGMEKAFSSDAWTRREERQGLVPSTPVAAQAPQDKQGDAGRLLRLMRYIGSAQAKRLRAQLGDVPTLGEIRRAVDSLPEGGPPVFNDQLTAQTPAVPEGWKLVPVEPTLEMLDSADDAIRDFPRPVSRYETPLAPKIAYYKAMLAAAPTPPASAAPAADGDALREAVKTAYGYLWHVNNEPGTPNQYAPERAAYEARKVLREHLTKDERGEGINVVRAAMQRNGSEK